MRMKTPLRKTLIDHKICAIATDVAEIFGKVFALAIVLSWQLTANAAAIKNELLVQFTNSGAQSKFVSLFNNQLRAESDAERSTKGTNTASKVEDLGGQNWVRIQLPNQQVRDLTYRKLLANADVVYVQPNFKLRLLENYKTSNQPLRNAILNYIKNSDSNISNKSVNQMRVGHPYPDNPAFVAHGPTSAGPDPEYKNQWGMNDNGVANAWKIAKGAGVVVAVIDSGVDYTHEDLVENLWHNSGEMGKDANGRDKSNNGVDDDANGYVDDVIGWDFVSNDNKPYDFAVNPIDLLMGGGNPGHGTHCAGNVAAVGSNGIGVAGVAPESKIMSLRFLSDKGEGDTAGAIKAINYGVKMGAKVLSNSWGSEGDDPNEAAANKALKDAITNAQNQNVLFVAAAGNGHQGVGYNNDTDSKPAYPASYDHENIVSVAAIDKSDMLGSFSNWGKKSVDIGAPGVSVFSTTVGGHYSDLVIDLPEYGIQAGWDGTSMACPHVAGAAALYWSKHPQASWRDVKSAILNSAKLVSSLNGKTVSNGKLDVENLVMK